MHAKSLAPKYQLNWPLFPPWLVGPPASCLIALQPLGSHCGLDYYTIVTSQGTIPLQTIKPL